MPRIDFITLEDFTGGINVRENTFQLAQNETPECLNVDFDQRGGFRLRGGVDAYGGSLAADAQSIFMFERTTGAAQLLVADGTNVVYKTGGTWTTAGAMSGYVSFSTFKNKVYCANGSSVASWDGSTWTAMADPSGAGSWNNNIESPNQGDVPVCKYLTAHRGVQFAAYTTEGGTDYPNRIRWSHPNFPEDWMETHFIDVDWGVDGDEIVGIEPMGDHLLVFKQRSVHAVYGSPPEQFEVYPVNTEVGACSPEAIQATDAGVFFYSWPDGLFRYDGKKFDWVHEKIHSLIQDGDVDGSYSEEIQLGWGNRRLWLSVPFEGSTTRSRTFVMDPALSKEGSWTQYDLPLGPFCEWRAAGDDAFLLANYVGGAQLVQTDQYDQPFDDPDGVSTNHIDSYYRTRWIDLGTVAFKKRWKRPQIVLRGGTDGTVLVEGYKNYDATIPTRHFSLQTTAEAAAGAWGTAVWDTDVWGRDIGVQSELERGSQLGNAFSVALKFYGPATNVDWGIDAITMKFIPRKVRN